jgi:hypothetical protein
MIPRLLVGCVLLLAVSLRPADGAVACDTTADFRDKVTIEALQELAHGQEADFYTIKGNLSFFSVSA